MAWKVQISHYLSFFGGKFDVKVLFGAELQLTRFCFERSTKQNHF